MIDEIRQILRSSRAFQRLVEAEGEETVVSGVAGSLRAFLVAALLEHHRRQVITIARDADAAGRLFDDLVQLIGPARVCLFAPGRQQSVTASPEKDVADVNALRVLQDSSDSVIVIPPAALLVPLPPPSGMKGKVLIISKGENRDLPALVKQLRDLGFIQQDFVNAHGDFAVRGGIVDIYTFAGENPIRAEFAGDDLESLREFDPLSQRSIRELTAASIVPNLLAQSDEHGNQFTSTVFDYARPDALVIMDEPEIMRNVLEAEARHDQPGSIPVSIVEEMLQLFPRVVVRGLGEGGIDFGSRPQPAFNGSVATLRRDLHVLQELGFTLGFTCDSPSEKARLKELVGTMPDSPAATPEPGERVNLEALQFTVGGLHEGFVLPESLVALYTEHQIFNRVKRRGQPQRQSGRRQGRLKGFSQSDLSVLHTGDYVVHADFGIGRYEGLKRIRVGGAEQEVVRVAYEGHDVLFVHLQHIARLQKYSSRDGHTPALSRLGTADWERLKERAKKKVKDIARDLILLYARRKRSEGFAFSPDTPWQKELEASFMFEDTFDQAKATLEAKKDMEAPNPMDRLICGDVGFGKTEVAIRAAFKAVLDGKQVAVLVPTTILAMQHLNTFRDRLAPYAVRLDVMSRFRSKKEQAAIATSLREGSLDIVIGTHRLLSKDIAFENLGLLVIDEEHRFGVSAKEKLRKLRSDVDTLAMTATPIPRTLHFSLLGARDLSIIATPPRNRIPIVTQMLQWNDGTIRDAVEREISRGGQVYFVHDRVQTMNDVVERLQALLPHVRMRAAHGQMSPRELENVMMAFLERQFEVLVATKIIESGLDIPNVNTIVINRADRFGMAELYQLRGRVGRSNVQAYAYLLIPPASVLPRQTIQRLQAVEEFTELGSGFNLAMRDLEIRGAGNLLGAEQSGFIENMGFETYTRILEEAVGELKDEEFKELFENEQGMKRGKRESVVETDLDAFIPELYIRGDADRLAMYRQLYLLTTPEQLKEVQEEMEDRFGKMPRETANLLEVVRLRLRSSGIGFAKVSVQESRLEVEFPPAADAEFFESERFQHIMARIAERKSNGFALHQDGTTLRLRAPIPRGATQEEQLAQAIRLLEELAGKDESGGSMPSYSS